MIVVSLRSGPVSGPHCCETAITVAGTWSSAAVPVPELSRAAHLGVRRVDLPCTPRRVRRVIRDAGSTDPWREADADS
jgi:hypothetical protein